MKEINTVEEMQGYAEARRAEGDRLALVPTMGALHAGHLALVERAGEVADHVVVSIFVNPTQFAPDEDYERYPRQLKADKGVLVEQGVADAVFAPSVKEMYPRGYDHQRIWIDVEGLDEHLCGRYRPGHFRGVLTVVMKLFNACRPHVGVFGLKDAQQFVIIQRMVEDLALGIEIEGVPTVREEDGLALSSRNEYLSSEQRQQAVVLSQAVTVAREAVERGQRSAKAVREAMHEVLRKAELGRVQYAEVVDADTLQPLNRIERGQEVLCAIAVFFGETRLIDNAFVTSPTS